MDSIGEMFVVDVAGESPDEESIPDKIKDTTDTVVDKESDFELDLDGDIPDQTEKTKLPSYKTEHIGYLATPEFSMETGKQILNEARPKKNCFNCMGDHSLGECTIKLDFRKIAENKKKLFGARTSSNVRYHEDPENKYDYLKPGLLSAKLKNALGVKPSQLPEHIYRMRILGYPPGWLREAEVHRSDVALIDGTGASIDHPEDLNGEVGNLVKYKPEKLIRFPGFNCSFSNRIRDDWRYYNACPMKKYHHIDEFRNYMNNNKSKGYKRKRLTMSDSPAQKSTSDEDSNDVNKLVINDHKKDKEKEEISSVKKIKPSSRSSTPQSIEDGELVSESETTNDPEDIKNIEEKEEPIETEEKEESIETEEKITIEKENKVFKVHKAIAEKTGTYISKSVSSFTKLPPADLWTVDVHDHILFENLPDSTGTWDQMKDVMKKVKTKMKNLYS